MKRTISVSEEKNGNFATMRYFIKLAFDGTDFSGWQIQPNRQTIQGEINRVLEQVTQEQISVVGCGRTDAGVHASQYYCHVDVNNALVDNIVYKLNSLLPDSIVIYDVFLVQDNQHSRFDATKRTYIYHTHFSKDPFRNRYSYHCFYRDLDFQLMQEAVSILANYSDFSSLSKSGEEENTLCTIYSAQLIENLATDGLELHISANRFLHNMIRRIMGLLITVGRKKISLKEVKDVLEHGGQFGINFVAPPEGLFLSEVQYPYIND